MSKLEMQCYSNHEYGDGDPLFKQRILTAWGTIDDVTHTYVRIASRRTGEGVVPAWFIDDAWRAFVSAAGIQNG